MVEFKGRSDHNVVSIRPGLDYREHVAPQAEAALEGKMNFMHGLDRDDILMALKISGSMLVALAASAVVTAIVLSS